MELTDTTNFWIRILIYTFGLVLTFDFIDQNPTIKTSTGLILVMAITLIIATFYNMFLCRKPKIE